MSAPVLILFLSGPQDLNGNARMAAVAIDCASGEAVAIDRYSGGTPEAAVARLQDREKWAHERIVRGPTLEVPARSIYDLTDRLKGRRMRRAL